MGAKLNNIPEVDFSDIYGNSIELTEKQEIVFEKLKDPIKKESSENHNILYTSIEINKNQESIGKFKNLLEQHLV